MAKTYTLQGPIFLETLSNTDALSFCAAVINAIPSYSMGTASLNIQAQGPAGTASCRAIKGSTSDELQAGLVAAENPKAPEDIVYDVNGRVNLVGLSFEDGCQIIDATMKAIPPDSLIMTSMLVQVEPPAK